MKATRLTTSGNAVTSAVSPDGKYVAYATQTGEEQELWLRQVAIASSVRLVPPSQVNYVGLTFARSGDFLYYVVYPKGEPTGTLSRIPLLGGEPQKLSTDVGTPITFSPDGKRIAFIRASQKRGADILMLADADGTNEQQLASRQFPGYGWFPMSGPAWSPDGQTIACLAASDNAGETSTSVIEVRVAEGTERTISTQRWEYAKQLAWLSDGSGLLITARDHASVFFQIWHLSYPEGTARRVTSVVRQTDHNLLLAARARFTFSRMSEALAVQTNGFGSVL
jgi:Tol biopolymer transport system component